MPKQPAAAAPNLNSAAAAPAAAVAAAPAAPVTPPAGQDPSILAGAVKAAADPNAQGAEPSQAEKEAQEAQATEEKRLLETPDDKLTAEDKPKKVELLKKKDEALLKQADELRKKSVPETYADFKLPEGFVMNKALLDKAVPFFKANLFSQEAAQAVIDLHVESMKVYQAQQDQEFKDTVKGMEEETKAALGPKYEEEMAFAARFRELAFSKETMELINTSGMGNSLPFVKDCIRIGKKISQDTLPIGAGAGGEKPIADRLFA